MKRGGRPKIEPRPRLLAIRHSPLDISILITAGPTREYIDPVRYLSNDSSGQMGFALAAEAKRRGYRVTLIHGPVNLVAPSGVKAIPVVSAADMLKVCEQQWRRHDVLIMAAAVADYRPRTASATKIKKQKADFTLELVPTIDILATLAARKKMHQRVIGFAVEDRKPRERARDKLVRKNLDAIVLNAPSAIAAKSSRIAVLLARGSEWRTFPMTQKTRHASTILDLLPSLLE